MAISEANFETHVEQALLDAGYRRRTNDDFTTELCLDKSCLFDFIHATQPGMWEKLERNAGADARTGFLRRLQKEVETRGTVDVLRDGIKDRGCSFQLAAFRPSSGLNPKLERLYRANQFSVVRQLHFSEERSQDSVDLVLFLNGLPLFTVELKETFTGQNVQDAVRQYEKRDPQEPLFAFGHCLAHLAVDPRLAFYTTHLRGRATRFFPFNQGYAKGAGNPPSRTDYATSYLWEDLWTPDSVLELVQSFVHLLEEKTQDRTGRLRTERKLIFPRYHQRDAVRRLVDDARDKGAGQRYLVQHSAGSGKSNTIAWLAHRLSTLHDDEDRRVFDSIFVITDRTVLDRQLQQVVYQFQRKLGVVARIEGTSQDLKQAIDEGKTIIVTTLQKFPVIEDQARALAGKRFALLIDEAHSSQSGESAKAVRKVLAAASLQEAAELEGGVPETMEDRIVERIEREMKLRGPLPNLSLFAFTATPKPKTLELFGTEDSNGEMQPFSLYPMKQAIEERFILDVLENYTTYTAYWRLRKKIEDDPRYEGKKARRLLRRHVDLQPDALETKAEVIAEHFREHVAHRIGGEARAMVVTRSRLHAVRLHLALRSVLEERRLPFRTLVAFSGTVKDPNSEQNHTEPGLNGFPDSQTVGRFTRTPRGQAPYRILVVAEKFQTGFDQPLLHTMYVDKPLSGVHAVQTLSRLNRIHPQKEEALVLDFVNEADQIRHHFEPYYTATRLTERTDPNRLYDLQTELRRYRLFDDSEVDAFAALRFGDEPLEAVQGRLHAVLGPVIQRFEERPPEEQKRFRSDLRDYVRLYRFLSQVIGFTDPELEKLYEFCNRLRRDLPIDAEEEPSEVTRNVALRSYSLHKQGTTKIELAPGAGELEPRNRKERRKGLAELDPLEPLSEIVAALNQQFGEQAAEVWAGVEDTLRKLERDAALDASVRANTRDNVRLTFDHKVDSNLQEFVDTNYRFYKRVVDDAVFGRTLKNLLFDAYMRDHRQAAGLIEQGESKTLELKSTLRWDLKKGRKSVEVTHAVLKTVAAFLNTEGGDLLIGVDDDGSVVGIEADRFENHDRFLLHLAQQVRNALGARAGTCIDPRIQYVDGKPVCVVACNRSPEPVFLRWKDMEKHAQGDLFVRSGPGTVRLSSEDAEQYIRTRFPDTAVLEAALPGSPTMPFTVVQPREEEKFVTCIPKVPLAAAAGSFSEMQTVDAAMLEAADEWVRPHTSRKLGPGMFVARVEGHSMEPTIPDGAWCLFRSPVRGSRQGKVVLALLQEATDPEHGGRYTVKRYVSSKEQHDEAGWRHSSIELRPLNTDFDPIVVGADDEVRVVAEWVDTLE